MYFKTHLLLPATHLFLTFKAVSHPLFKAFSWRSGTGSALVIAFKSCNLLSPEQTFFLLRWCFYPSLPFTESVWGIIITKNYYCDWMEELMPILTSWYLVYSSNSLNLHLIWCCWVRGVLFPSFIRINWVVSVCVCWCVCTSAFIHGFAG